MEYVHAFKEPPHKTLITNGKYVIYYLVDTTCVSQGSPEKQN